MIVLSPLQNIFWRRPPPPPWHHFEKTPRFSQHDVLLKIDLSPGPQFTSLPARNPLVNLFVTLALFPMHLMTTYQRVSIPQYLL